MEENKKNKIPNVPNLRLSGFANDYQKTKIGRCLKIKSGQDQKGICCDNGKYKIFGTGGVIGTTNFFLYDKESVGIGRKGTIDKPFFFDEPFWTVDTLFYSVIYKGFSPKYIYYLFQTINWKKYNSSTGVPSLTSSTIESIDISIPSLEEQCKVSKFLTLIDQRIETQNKIIEKYESLIKQLNDDLFSHDINSKIGEYIQESSKRNKDGSITNVLSVSNKNGFVKQSEQFEDKELASEDKTNYKIVQKGDFAFNPARINVGSIALLKNQEIGIVSPMYICFKARNIPNEVLESYFSSSSFKKEMNKRLEGSVRMCLTIDGMKNIHFHKPNEKEIDILNHLSKLKELVNLNKRISDLYNSQKSYLLSNLFI